MSSIPSTSHCIPGKKKIDRIILQAFALCSANLHLTPTPAQASNGFKKNSLQRKCSSFEREKKRNPFDLFGQSLLTYIERRLLRKAKKGEEGKLRDASAHIFSFLSIFPEGSKHVIMLYSGKSGCIIIIDLYTVAQK